MLTLYGNLESGNVYKVRLILTLTGVKHRRVEVNQVQGDPRSARISRHGADRQSAGGQI